jgi:hypothetical protein
MAYSRESLNSAICLKLEDIDQASGMHKVAFCTTQLAGAGGVAGAILIAPLALEVGAIAAVAGGIFYGISQLMQTKRTGHFLPLPGVPISAGQLTHGFSSIVSSLMGSAAPPAPEEVRLLPTDWLPQRERRINYLLTHCPDLLINAAESAQDGISFAAIVDTAVRASEFAISDEQLNNPIIGLKLAGEVRKVLQGDTSSIEAQQNRAIAQEYQRAKAELEAGAIASDEFAAIEAQVREIAPDVLDGGVGVAVGAIAPAVCVAANSDWDKQLERALGYPVLSIVGPQGTYKTTLLNYLVSRLDGFVVVLDPHAKKSDWAGCCVIGRGMRYDQISTALGHAQKLTKIRYTARAEDDVEDFEKVVYVAEELTNWAEHVQGVGPFLKSALSDFRKANQQLIKVAHGETNIAQGGGKGTAKMRTEGECLIKLTAPGQGTITFPSSEPTALEFPDLRSLTVNSDKKLPPADLRAMLTKPEAIAQQTTIDVASSPAAAPTERSQWERCKDYTSLDGLRDLMEWIEGTSKTQFTPRDAHSNRQLRDKIDGCTTASLRSLMAYLVEQDLLLDVGTDSFQKPD